MNRREALGSLIGIAMLSPLATVTRLGIIAEIPVLMMPPIRYWCWDENKWVDITPELHLNEK